jgi:hypothetical protein
MTVLKWSLPEKVMKVQKWTSSCMKIVLSVTVVLREWRYIFRASLKRYNEGEWYIVAQDLIWQHYNVADITNTKTQN